MLEGRTLKKLFPLESNFIGLAQSLEVKYFEAGALADMTCMYPMSA